MHLALIAVFPLVLLLASLNSTAAEPQKNYPLEITAMARQDALIEFASQTGYEILFVADARPEGMVEAINGEYAINEVLDLWLANSNFAYYIDGTQIRITRVTPKSSVLEKITVLAYLRDASSRISQDDDSQDRFPLYQVPLSIQSISQDHIEDVQARDLSDTVLYVGGVAYLEPASGFQPRYYSRGIVTPFSIDGKFYRRSGLELDTAVIDRIDLIQGPSANYLQPGGMLNFVTKKPSQDSEYIFSLSAGSEDHYRTVMDVNVGLHEDAQHAIRVIAVAEKKDHFKKFAGSEKYVVAPSLDIALTDDTQLLMSLYHQVQEEPPNTLTYHESLAGEHLPRDLLLALPWANVRTENTTFALDVTKLDWLGWHLSAGTNISHSDSDISLVAVAPLVIQDVFYGNYLLHIYQKDNVTKSHGFDASAEKGFSVGGHSMLLRIGLDYQNYDQSLPSHGAANLLSQLPVDINDLDYSIAEPQVPPARISIYEQLTDFYGINLALSYYFTDNLVLHGDIRYEDMKLDGELESSEPLKTYRGRYKEFTPQLGLNATFTDTFSTHVSFAESFSHQSVYDRPVGVNLSEYEFSDPAKNRQYELSLKKMWLEGNLLSSLTFYKLKSTEQLTGAGEDMGTRDVEDQRSKGVSLSVTGWLTENMNVIANASYNDNELKALPSSGIPNPNTSPGLSLDDSRLHGTAKNTANVWINYEVNSGVLENFEFGFGANYIGTRYGDDFNSDDFILDSYVKADSTIKYKGFSNITLAFAVRNMFDKVYYNSSLGTRYFVEDGEPRNFSISVKTTRGF